MPVIFPSTNIYIVIRFVQFIAIDNVLCWVIVQKHSVEHNDALFYRILYIFARSFRYRCHFILPATS